MPERSPSTRPPRPPDPSEPLIASRLPGYAELLAASNFSFLRGASHPEELAAMAAGLGLAGFAIADRNSLAGIVRGHLIAKERGMRYAVGCRLVFRDGTPDIAVWPRDRAGYGHLCRLLTTGNLRGRKGECHLHLADLLTWGDGLEMAVLAASSAVPTSPLRGGRTLTGDARQSSGGGLQGSQRNVRPHPKPAKPVSTSPQGGGYRGGGRASALATLAEAFRGHVRLGASLHRSGEDHRRLAATVALAARHGVPVVALGDVLYHAPERRRLQDVISCVREHRTMENAGRLLEANAERHLKDGAEMTRLFADHPQAIAETLRVFERLTFSLDELKYEYPLESAGASATPREELERLTWAGAAWRYPSGVPDGVRKILEHELAIIRHLEYEPYFLTVRRIMEFAREKDILCQGRGSAANSAVCYCLQITDVNPDEGNLLFERFISKERGEPPDIDVDFEHARREEVIQFVFDTYGREHAGIAATVITYRSRSAAREVGKAFGLSEDATGALAGNVWGWSSDGVSEADARRAGLDPADGGVAQVLGLTQEIGGFPRHLSQHVGGFVITRSRLDEVVPVLNAAMDGRQIIEWDKDDLDALKMLKVDVLSLGMLTAINESFRLLETHYGRQLTLATVPKEDPEVYDMICRADTVGVFQIESRAQMTMLPRLRPRKFYDLVIEVAIVRPGPIQGDMVHPYLRRRQGLEIVKYPEPAPPRDPDELRNVLHKTLGVPLFQEQAMRIAIVAAKFEPWEADKLRRAMATFRRVGTIGTFKTKMIEGMAARGYERAFAERCFSQIEGFGEYGFPESHAASFALLVYASAWLKCRYPDVFCAGLLNAQPMGFYAPAQLVRDALEHGVEVREVDVNLSDWNSTLEPLDASPLPLRGKASEGGVPAVHRRHAGQEPAIRTARALRLGLRQIKGFREAEAAQLVKAREAGPFHSVRELWLRSGISRGGLEKLAQADAFRSIGLDRRAALWEVRALDPLAAAERLPLFAAAETAGTALQREPAMALPVMPEGEHVVSDYRALSLSLKAHPVSFLRGSLERRGFLPAEQLAELRSGRRVNVAGLVLVRQRPGTASGVIFATLEDETGVANVIVWPKVFERFRVVVLGARLLGVSGRLQSEQGVIHVVAEQLTDLSPLLTLLSDAPLGTSGMAPTDEVLRPVNESLSTMKSRSRLAALLAADPALAGDLVALQRATAAVMPKGRNFH